MAGKASVIDTETDQIVRFVSVEKTFDGLTNVVHDLNLSIRHGEFLTLLGPSGSGKTTILMMLAGFEVPTAGEILLKGRSIGDLPPFKRNIGIVFQNYALFPHMTVFKNVAYPLERRKLAKAHINERVINALQMVELEAFVQRRPAQLSGGQQQRVALARALVFEPDLVLMDEPLGALDKKLREQMQVEIKHLHDRLGMTVVYVTHDQSEALTMSDRVAILHGGVIQQIDSPKNVYENPTNPFVANFIGENNNLHGTIEQVDAEICTVRLKGGQRVTAKCIGNLNPGMFTTLSIRPERVLLSREGDNLNNCLTAMIVEVIYCGDHSSIRVSIGGADLFSVKAPLNLSGGDLRPGESICIGWNMQHCRAFQTDPSTSYKASPDPGK